MGKSKKGEIIMEKEDRLFEKFLELRHRFSVEDLWFVFTRKKAIAFEALRLKFFAAGCQA